MGALAAGGCSARRITSASTPAPATSAAIGSSQPVRSRGTPTTRSPKRVSIHVTRSQATDFTARLVGVDVEEITSEDEIRDAVGEITNMLAGNVKTALATMGVVEIALPTVVMTPKAELRVRGARGVAVPFDDYTGVFHVEVVLSDGGEPAPLERR